MNSRRQRKSKPIHTPSQEAIQRRITYLLGRLETLQEEQDIAIAELKHLSALQRGENPRILPSKKPRKNDS